MAGDPGRAGIAERERRRGKVGAGNPSSPEMGRGGEICLACLGSTWRGAPHLTSPSTVWPACQRETRRSSSCPFPRLGNLHLVRDATRGHHMMVDQEGSRGYLAILPVRLKSRVFVGCECCVILTKKNIVLVQDYYINIWEQINM